MGAGASAAKRPRTYALVPVEAKQHVAKTQTPVVFWLRGKPFEGDVGKAAASAERRHHKKHPRTLSFESRMRQADKSMTRAHKAKLAAASSIAARSAETSRFLAEELKAFKGERGNFQSGSILKAADDRNLALQSEQRRHKQAEMRIKQKYDSHGRAKSQEDEDKTRHSLHTDLLEESTLHEDSCVAVQHVHCAAMREIDHRMLELQLDEDTMVLRHKRDDDVASGVSSQAAADDHFRAKEQELKDAFQHHLDKELVEKERRQVDEGAQIAEAECHNRIELLRIKAAVNDPDLTYELECEDDWHGIEEEVGNEMIRYTQVVTQIRNNFQNPEAIRAKHAFQRDVQERHHQAFLDRQMRKAWRDERAERARLAELARLRAAKAAANAAATALYAAWRVKETAENCLLDMYAKQIADAIAAAAAAALAAARDASRAVLKAEACIACAKLAAQLEFKRKAAAAARAAAWTAIHASALAAEVVAAAEEAIRHLGLKQDAERRAAAAAAAAARQAALASGVADRVFGYAMAAAARCQRLAEQQWSAFTAATRAAALAAAHAATVSKMATAAADTVLLKVASDTEAKVVRKATEAYEVLPYCLGKQLTDRFWEMGADELEDTFHAVEEQVEVMRVSPQKKKVQRMTATWVKEGSRMDKLMTELRAIENTYAPTSAMYYNDEDIALMDSLSRLELIEI